MNKLASFNFLINYKPSAQNHVAENLSKFAIYKDSCTSEYSELCDAGGIKSILDVTVNQQNNNESWISTVNMLSTSYNDIQAKLLYNWDDAAVCLFARDNIRKAQDQENWIRKMKDVKEFHKNLTAPDVAKESFQIKRLWRELHNIRYFTGNVMKTTKWYYQADGSH